MIEQGSNVRIYPDSGPAFALLFKNNHFLYGAGFVGSGFQHRLGAI